MRRKDRRKEAAADRGNAVINIPEVTENERFGKEGKYKCSATIFIYDLPVCMSSISFSYLVSITVRWCEQFAVACCTCIVCLGLNPICELLYLYMYSSVP